MLTLYHAPRSRSSRIVTLIDEIGAQDAVTIRSVTIPRQDGTGGADPANPHPEGKVPLLVHGNGDGDGDGNEVVWETTAIVQHLTNLFPEPLAPAPGERGHGTYLSWLAWYAAVVEPVMVLGAAGIEHPICHATFRGMPELTARLARALEDAPYLMGESYSAADLILASPFAWFPDATPDVPSIRNWVRRTQDRPAVRRTAARDAKWMAAELHAA